MDLDAQNVISYIRYSNLDPVSYETLVPLGTERCLTPTAAVCEVHSIYIEALCGMTTWRHGNELRYDTFSHSVLMLRDLSAILAQFQVRRHQESQTSECEGGANQLEEWTLEGRILFATCFDYGTNQYEKNTTYEEKKEWPTLKSVLRHVKNSTVVHLILPTTSVPERCRRCRGGSVRTARTSS